MQIQIQVDATEFWPSLDSDIGQARKRVYVHTLSFEGDAVGKGLAGSLIACAASDRRVIADDFYTKYKINDKFYFKPSHFFDRELRKERRESFAMIADLEANGVHVKLTNPAGPLGIKAFARNHKKLIVIDDNISYIGGINFAEHNFVWHDMMIRIEDPDVARFLGEDFLSSWQDEHNNSSRKFDGMEIYRFDGRGNQRTFEPIMELMANAKKSIWVECPYMSFPFYQSLAQARRNGAIVTLVTPAEDNWSVFKDYGLWEAQRAGIDAMHYKDRLTHLKAMLIDDTHLVVGSANFYFISHFMQEIIAVITSRDAIEQFKTRVVAVDEKRSVRPDKTVGELRGRMCELRLKIGAGLCSVFGRMTGR